MDTQNLQISVAKSEDLPRVIELWKEQYDYHYNLDPTYYAPFTDDMGKKVQADLLKTLEEPEQHLLIAKYANEIIGFITFGADEDTYYDANITKYGVVKEVLVTGEFRGRGVGAALINEVEKHFSGLGIKNMMIQCSSFNGNALAVYDKLGYKEHQKLLYKEI
jgi:GNAT superfamily N-acetyltransferase